MSYRKNSKRENSWKRWLKEHQAFLTEECGLPLAIVVDQEEWFHFLDHGYSRTISCPRLNDRQWSLYLEFHKEHEDSEFAGISSGMLPILLRARENEASRLKAKYITVDGMVSGTGIRDSYSGEYLVLNDLGLSRELSEELTRWLEAYRISFYSGHNDSSVVEELDEDGLEICRCVSSELPECKVGYYSDALCKKLVFS